MTRKILACAAAMAIAGCGDKGGGSSDDADAAMDTAGDDAGTDTVADLPDAAEGDTAGEGDDTGADAGCVADGDCDDSDPCTVDDCDTDYGECSHDPLDSDGDGYFAAEVGGTTCAGNDCDDSDADVNPGAAVGCTASDMDCSDLPDNDDDGDGYVRGAAAGALEDCGGDDCDDADAAVNPGAANLCALTDQDCDGVNDCAAPECPADPSCVCPPPATVLNCDGHCVDTASDPDHCGSCTADPCPTGAVCSVGACACVGDGMWDCGGPACVNLNTDFANCNACGHTCDAGQTCVDGDCTP